MSVSSEEPPASKAARVLIFDTTLRDGEQSPGCSMTLHEKLRVAHALADLGVDVIEAGFPIASPGDFEAVRSIAELVAGPTIAALARCDSRDIDAAARALLPAPKRRLHVFLATSAIHREHKLGLSREGILERVRHGVSLARESCEDVEFSPEDATRTERGFLLEVLQTALDAGATTLNIADTVGYSMPHEYGDLIGWLRKEVRCSDDVVFSTHCHDDLGLAVANSLAGVRAGARQVECTINGIGERAGNAALEEIVMALQTRRDLLECETAIETTRLEPTSRLVSRTTGATVPPNKAIVGRNAFAHEAGIHQHGFLKERTTYEIMRPESVGFAQSTLVLGKHSGKHAVRDAARRLGFHLDANELDDVSRKIKALADRKKTVEDGDLEALVLGYDPEAVGPVHLESLQTFAGTDKDATASVGLRIDTIDEEGVGGEVLREAAVGDGPIHATFCALSRATGWPLELIEFRLRSVSGGEDAQGEALVRLRYGDEEYKGRGASTDVVEASALAVLQVINRLMRRRRSGREEVGREDASLEAMS